MASYNAVSGRLHLPSIAVGGEIVYRNVIFDLIDSATATFELRSSNRLFYNFIFLRWFFRRRLIILDFLCE
jgi:hypothetical protein